ncbi:hypothetical protein DIURU_002128 [Diutina rugosa]|uniref:DNA repair and recombination protein RDH54 n=1 Tax=Diutina rugosa TaxID=5481 RepID=A0A642URE4_DIURU|nr:uncharacterized protein DIURU_002128 [Diutina rugosa]KAA8903906.1 hypothetical protein DIURU_002128 [Diutina rugosa]
MNFNAPYKPPRRTQGKSVVKKVPTRRNTMLRPSGSFRCSAKQVEDFSEPDALFVAEETDDYNTISVDLEASTTSTLLPATNQQSHVVPPTHKHQRDYEQHSVQWRRRTTKKNKTWEGDGILIINYVPECNQAIITLKNADGPILARKRLQNLPLGWKDVEIVCGNYELEIEQCDSVEEPVKRRRVIKALQPRSVTKNPPPSISKPKAVFTLDPTLESKLRPHQRDGVKFMFECISGLKDFAGNGCILADEMGLGKTLQVIALVHGLIKTALSTSTAPKVVIVCPLTLISNWMAEFKKWVGPTVSILRITDQDQEHQIRKFGELQVYQVMIVNYEKVVSNAQLFTDLANLDLIVCDEGHRLKSTSSKTWTALSRLPCKKRIILSGTPVQNDLNEFYSLIDFVNPGILGNPRDFQRDFVMPISNSREINNYAPEVKQLGESASAKLLEITSKFMLRRTSSIMSSHLPPRIDTILFVRPTSLQVKIYEKILANSRRFDQMDALATINLLRKLCNSPRLLANDELWKSICSDFAESLKITSGKINLLVPMLQEIVSMNEKIVIVSNFTSTLDLIQSVLEKLELAFIRLDGQTHAKHRSKLVREFETNSQISCFLLSSKAGGVGLNLVSASRLILFDNDWNPSVDLQSMGRIHREGQTKPCYIYRLVTTGCIDEKILQRQLMKGNLSAAFVDSISGTDNAFFKEDLCQLFEIDLNTDSNTHDLIACRCKSDFMNESLDLGVAGSIPIDDSIVSANSVLESMKTAKKESFKVIARALNEYTHISTNTQDVHSIKDTALKKILTHESFDAPVSFILTKSS